MTAVSTRGTGGAERLIADIWEKRVEGIIHQLRYGLEDYLEISNLYEHISDDYHGRFLIELLQNASDQAHLAGLTQSAVDVVRTSDRLYVANQGLVFTAKGLDRMTKLGLSDKDPSKAIGNKGVGFKSVRQVSRHAEVFSAANLKSSFTGPGGLRFGLRLGGSLPRAELDRLRELVVRVAARMEADPNQLRSATEIEQIMAALTRTPPFRFPTGLGEQELNATLQDLNAEIALRAQTVVALELLRDGQATLVVDRAIDELIEHGGASVLFLPGVTTIHLADRVRDRVVRISREIVHTEKRGEVVYSHVRTAVQESMKSARDWHKVDRTLGTDANDAKTAESAAIREAAQSLPGEGWAEVSTATISVALPTGDLAEPSGAPLPPEGLFVIGLPTRKPTGTPFWIDGRFHGKISRTEIDLEQTPYNALLFEGAKKLVVELIDVMRGAPQQTRRLVTRAMKTSTGELATWMRSADGPASGEVVLLPDGQRFQRAADLRLPRAEDVELVLRLSGGDLALLSGYGFVLPELPLLRDSRELLEQLGARVPGGRSDPAMLNRAEGLSLLEWGAVSIRDAGPTSWEQFLDDVLDRFDGGQLTDQTILPIGQHDLARPTERIFYAPRDETEDEVLSIPPQVAHDLRFLDESAVPMRAGPRALTAIGRRIGEDGAGLVRPPRINRLISDAIAPRLEILVAEGRDEPALALLAQAIEWLPRVAEDELTAATRNVRIPCTTADGTWTWRNAHEVYFGRGWLGGSPTELHREELIAKAYSRPFGRLVVPWSELSIPAAGIHDREWWRDGLAQLGVNSVPRILVAEPLGRAADFRASGYRLQVNSAPLPEGLPEGAGRYWAPYLARLASSTTAVPYHRGQFVVRRAIWVDGLEDEAARDAVFELMLMEPTRFLDLRSTSVVRMPQLDGAVLAQAFWLDVIRHEDWPIVPTAHHGAERASRCWIVGGDGARSPGYAELPEVRREFAHANELLGAIGVANLGSPSVERAVAALHRVATVLGSTTASTVLRDLDIVSQRLYEGLSRACDQADVDLTVLVTHPVPVRIGGAPVSVDLQAVAAVYVDDDPARGQFVPSDMSHPFLPVPSRSAIAGLTRALGRVLGPNRVVRTSEAEIDTGFEPDGEERSLIEFLGADISRDLALLFAYGRRKEADPAGEAFRSIWDTFVRTRLRRGDFPVGGRAFAHRCFFDPNDPAGPRLDVAADDAPGVIPLLWTIFGPDARDPLIAYVTDLSHGEPARFFLERQIGDLQRREVEDALGAGVDANFEKVRDVLYAVWAKGRLTRSLAEFQTEWVSRSSVDDRARWLGVDRDALITLFHDADDASRLRLLSSAGMSVDEWQSTRADLDLPSHRFAQTERDYTFIRNGVAWGLASVAAHSPGVDLDQARTALEKILAFTPTDELLVKPTMTSADIRAFALRASGPLQGVRGVDVLVSRLKDLADAPPSRAADLIVRYANQREIEQFRDISHAQRTQWAQLTLDNLMKVAAALAQNRGLAFDEAAVRTDSRVVKLSSGWWASDFALLSAVESAVRRFGTDQIAATLTGANAFRDPPHDWRRLWARVDELGPLPVETATTLPPVKVGGLSLTFDEIARDLRDLGPEGRVARQLIAALDDEPPFASLRQTERASVALPTRTRRTRGGRPVRVAKAPRAETTLDRELNGLLGEVFVFEECRRHLRDFDEKAWVSENRLRYIPSSVGATDAEGFDFDYRDSAGLLTGRSDSPTCHIEVKATSGDGTNAFPITAPEWEHAKRCHDTGEALYLIVRVGNVRSDSPRITDILVDPVDLWHRGQLVVDAQNFWVHVGVPESRPS